MWDLIVSVSDQRLSFYFVMMPFKSDTAFIASYSTSEGCKSKQKAQADVLFELLCADDMKKKSSAESNHHSGKALNNM